MLSVTADTNIYISGLEFGGIPRRFLLLARAGRFRLDISEPITNEIVRVLQTKFAYDSKALHEVQARISSITHVVTPVSTMNVITVDPPDNRILECAEAARSDFIVTGDKKHLLPLGSFAGTPIVTAAEFLKFLNRPSP